MADIEKIKQVEREQQDLIDTELQKAKERISRAEADASFRVSKVLQERKGTIKEIVSRSRDDFTKEIDFMLEKSRSENAAVLENESRNVDRAVENILKSLIR